MRDGFDQLAGAGGLAGLLGIGMQIPGVTLALRGALDEHGNDVDQAAVDRELFVTWDEAEPESRSALLLNLAWAAREGQLREDDESHGHGYAAELHRYAVEFTGDSEAFHGPRFPAMPLPGQAGALASSLGFDRDDTAISLKSVLLLMAAIPPEPAAG